MLDKEKVEALIAETGGFDPQIAAIVQTGDGAWAVQYQEDLDVEIEMDEERDLLIILTVVGTPPASRRLELLEAMMAYNMLVQETGGVRMALTGTGGEAVQMLEVPFESLQAKDLATICANMVDKTLTWRTLFVADDDGATMPPPGQDSSAITFQS